MKSNTRWVMAFLVLIFLAAGFAGYAISQTVTWTPATGWTDNTGKTGTFTSAEQATMKFYLRAKKQGATGPRAYFAETINGVKTWTGDFATQFVARGLPAPVPGETWEFTVSQAFPNPSGAESDSAESAVALYQFPFPPDRTPGAPAVPAISE